MPAQRAISDTCTEDHQDLAKLPTCKTPSSRTEAAQRVVWPRKDFCIYSARYSPEQQTQFHETHCASSQAGAHEVTPLRECKGEAVKRRNSETTNGDIPMSEVSNDPVKVNLAKHGIVARLSFPNLFKPSKPKDAPDTQELKYSATLLFKKGEDLSVLKAAAKAAIKDKWGDKPPKNLRTPFRDQGEKEYEGYEEGAIFISTTSKKRPGVVNARVERIEDEDEIYPGCYVYATVRAFAYDRSGNKGVSFGLQNIQKVKDGEPLGGRVAPEHDFEAIEGEDGGDDLDSLLDD